MTIQMCWRDTPIGEHRTLGKTLDKAAFLALRPVDRLRAYLLMVWPGARATRCVSRVCRIRAQDIGNFLKSDLRDGTVRHPAPGQWRACPVAAEERRP